ncbi:C-type lectin domain family 4 member M-like isoform X2 [Toxotes jaculatrix]|uniref:C-type lectin domain family 4 member M-like isoform X2 n=1 Tax=Toxotes jaculatrix TaxID=941984 RepID=UPI001B3A8DEF|nr:C-type lectin domain family 4 member M-like isoform X2 [Toxotes jaculatrix]
MPDLCVWSNGAWPNRQWVYMMRVFHEEQPEISMDYVNQPDPSARGPASNSHTGAVTPAASGRKVYRLVGVSFGLLCILQAALNICLHLAFYHLFQQGWVYFHPSFYYISSIKKSWQDSRDDCLQRDADLVIINSKGEQDFTRTFREFRWIGLSETNGMWKWVDGTPLTDSYWHPGEPNKYYDRDENCTEIRFHEDEKSWNDIECGTQNTWICEKTVAL